MEAHAQPTTETETSTEPIGVVRRRLGRGLNALLGGSAADDVAKPAGAESAISETETSRTGHDSNHIPVECITRNPFQPRKEFAAEALNELADSIKQHGVLQPLLVRSHGGQFQLIAGERRWLAAKQAGLQHVPCRVLELDDQRVCEAAIEENLKRKDLNVLEKAQAFQDYLDRFHSSIEELAKQLSMNRSTLSNYLRLLELPEPVKQALAAEKISNGHARALLTLDEANQIALCKRISTESLSVRKTEEAVRALQGDEQTTIPFPVTVEKPEKPQPSNHVLSLQDQLRERLGAKVEIRQTGKDSGKIIISFHSHDEFEHLLRQLRPAA